MPEKQKSFIVRLEDGTEHHSPHFGIAVKRADYEARFGHTAQVIECDLHEKGVVYTAKPE
jgi:hypothetical protein